MYIECLQRHLAICGFQDLPRFAKHDPNFWNLISALGPEAPDPPRRGFRDHLRVVFHDIRSNVYGRNEANRTVTTKDLQQVFDFADRLGNLPLLIHCVAGVSRSSAIALSLILRGMLRAGNADPSKEALDTLLAIRPLAKPNPLVLYTGLCCFLGEQEAEALTDRTMADERVARIPNRFQESLEE